MASTYPNRHYQWGAQDGGRRSNALPPQTRSGPGSRGRRSSTARMARGLTARYYASDLPFAALYGQRGHRLGAPGRRSSTPTRRPASCRNIAFVDPPFLRRGQGDLRRRASARRHPPRPGVHVRRRPRVHRVAAVPARRAVHQLRRVGRLLRPRRAAPRPRRPREPPDLDKTGGSPASGSRACASRRSRAHEGGVSHMPVTHESILKLISYRFGLGYLNKRHRYASNIGRSFDFEHPNFELPTLPDPAAIARHPCAPMAGKRRARSRTTWRSSRARACSSGSATRSRRRPPTASSASPTGS